MFCRLFYEIDVPIILETSVKTPSPMAGETDNKILFKEFYTFK